MSSKLSRSLGSIFTPPDFARFLSSWAIRNPEDRVLDIGIGEGVFVFSALERLVAIGANTDIAREHIFGAEIHEPSYAAFLGRAKRFGGAFPNIKHADFFDTDFPMVDAVIGNPPYVRRTYLDDVDRIRERVLNHDRYDKSISLTRSTDLYVYFILHAISRLTCGGRLATIIADSWLNVGYGVALKAYLRDHFTIDSLVSLDRRVFEDAEVKPVLLLATRVNKPSLQSARFFRIHNGMPIENLAVLMREPENQHPDVTVHYVPTRELAPELQWGAHFRAPHVQQVLASHPLMTPIGNLAQTRIGVQTLAKEFFVLTADQARKSGIEPEFLEPLAQSSRGLERSIEPEQEPLHYLFYCSQDKEQLAGTCALEYILRGERATVSVRGKGSTVVGFHEKERIQQARRNNWYDLRTELERRGRGAILIPRLIYRNYTVIWNKAGHVPGELFIEVLPLPLGAADAELYLAILNSSITEFMLRSHAQLYGGGTYNIGPGQIKLVPIIDPSLLSQIQKKMLRVAYHAYLTDPLASRTFIDEAIRTILKESSTFWAEFERAFNDLITATVHPTTP